MDQSADSSAWVETQPRRVGQLEAQHVAAYQSRGRFKQNGNPSQAGNGLQALRLFSPCGGGAVSRPCPMSS